MKKLNVEFCYMEIEVAIRQESLVSTEIPFCKAHQYSSPILTTTRGKTTTRRQAVQMKERVGNKIDGADFKESFQRG